MARKGKIPSLDEVEGLFTAKGSATAASDGQARAPSSMPPAEPKRRGRPAAAPTPADDEPDYTTTIRVPGYVAVQTQMWLRDHPDETMRTLILRGLQLQGIEVREEDLTPRRRGSFSRLRPGRDRD